MNGTKELHAAIEKIYRTALDADGWPSALVAVASVAGGSGALLMVVDPLTGAVRSIAAGGFEDAFVRRYRDEFAPRDPWLRALVGRPPGTVVSSESLEAKHRKEGDPRLDEFLRAHDGGHVLGAVLGERQDDKAVIAVHRPHDAGAHRPAHLRHLELLLPHLRNAVDLVARAGAAEARSACLEELLELLPLGIFLVDAGMQVVLSNRFARRLAATRDGLVIRDGRLRALDPVEDGRLEQIVKAVANTAPGDAPVSKSAIGLGRPGRPHSLHVLGLPVSRAAGDALGKVDSTVAILVGDPDTEISASEGVIGALYGLTNAESRLVGALVSGLRVRDLAESFGISEQTIRTQLKRVLQKTGAGRQSELVRFLLTGPSLFTCGPDDDAGE